MIDTSKTNLFYETLDWKQLRYKVLRKYGKNCMLCGIEAKSVHVDHIKPLSLFWNLRLDFDNLQVLCSDCNLGKSNLFEDDFRPKNYVTLTKNHIEMAKSARGGFSKRQLALLGVSWPPKRGWKKKIIGKTIKKSSIEKLHQINSTDM